MITHSRDEVAHFLESITCGTTTAEPDNWDYGAVQKLHWFVGWHSLTIKVLFKSFVPPFGVCIIDRRPRFQEKLRYDVSLRRHQVQKRKL